MICPNCGKKLDVSKQSCSRCGEAIVLGGKINFNIDIQRAVPKAVPPSGVPAMPSGGVTTPPPAKKSNAWIYGIISGVAALMLCVLVVFIALPGDDDKNIIEEKETVESIQQAEEADKNRQFKELHEQVKKDLNKDKIKNQSLNKEETVVIYAGEKVEPKEYSKDAIIDLVYAIDDELGKNNNKTNTLIEMSGTVTKESAKELFEKYCPVAGKIDKLPEEVVPFTVTVNFNVAGEKLRFKDVAIDFSATLQDIILKKSAETTRSKVFKAADKLVAENDYKCIVVLNVDANMELSQPKPKAQTPAKPKPSQSAPPPASGSIPNEGAGENNPEKCSICQGTDHKSEAHCANCKELNCDPTKHCSRCGSKEHTVDYHCPACDKEKGHPGFCYQ